MHFSEEPGALHKKWLRSKGLILCMICLLLLFDSFYVIYYSIMYCTYTFQVNYAYIELYFYSLDQFTTICSLAFK